MKGNKLFIIGASLLLFADIQAQSNFGIWNSAEIKKNIFRGLDASFEGEFRTSDGIKEVERWTLSPSISYRICPYLKTEAKYTFIYKQEESRTTKKGNYIPSYWSPRHRFSYSLTGSYTWNRWEFSLRERYQFTRRTAMSVSKYGENGSKKADEYINAKSKHVLRSRVQVAWDIRKSPFTPYASCELYHNIEGWAAEKTRWSVGTTYKLNKKHSFDLLYCYQNHADDDEASGHVLSLGYKFKF